MKLKNYEQTERKRVDKYKDELRDNEKFDFGVTDRLEKAKIERSPSFFRKLGRTILDEMGIRPYRLEERREKQAMAVALNEHQSEVAAKKMAEEEARRKLEAEKKRQEEERRIAEEERERAALENDMANAHAWINYEQVEDFKNQRAQEILEKKLNARLTTIDQLDDEVAAENPEVEKHTVEFEGAEVPIYTLRGLPFAMLNHTVTYRRVNKDDPNHIGSQTSQELVKHPEIWTMRRDEVEQDPDYGTRNGRAKGDVISCSYINSEANIKSRVDNTGSYKEPDLCYGFSRLEGDALISATDGDGGTSNMGGRGRTNISELQVDFLDKLEKAGGNMYNELVLRRYTDNGVARRPDYIIASNGSISDDMLHHAKFFRIPIININYQSYYDKMHEKGAEILQSVSEKDNYLEIAEKMDTLYEMAVFKSQATPFVRLEDNDIATHINSCVNYYKEHPYYKNVDKLQVLEIEKRISFLEDELKAMMKECREKTEAKEYYYADSSPNCKSFHYFRYGEDENGEFWDIQFTRKGGYRSVHSEIFKKPGQQSKKYGAYERLVPLLHELKEAENENHEMVYEALQANKES